MIDSRIVEHLKIFTSEEKNDFLRYANAMRLYEKDITEDALHLLKYLLKNLDNEKKLQKELVYQHIYPNEALKSGRIEKLMSALVNLVKQYISFSIPTQNLEINQLLTLSKFYRERKQYKFFEQNIHQLEKYQQNIQQLSFGDYLNNFLISNEITLYKSELNVRKENQFLLDSSTALDIYYLMQRLDYSLVILIQNQYLPYEKMETIKADIEQVLNLVQTLNLPENKYIQLYLQGILLYTEQNQANKDAAFYLFIELLEKNKNEIEAKRLSSLCTLAQNYCTQQYNSGRKEFLLLLFELFVTQLNMGLLYINGQIHVALMNNIIIVGLKLKKYEFVKSFLDNHKEIMTGTQTDLVWQYNLAYYLFETKDINAALAHLPNYHELQDTYISIAARILEIKILYTLNDDSKYDLLGSKIDAFKNFLFECKKNKRLSELIFKVNNDFVDLLKQIRNTIKNDATRIEKLKLKYHNTPAIAEREWLCAQLEALG
jgi:hypothetical protein